MRGDVVAGVACAALVAGCGSGSVSGQAGAEGSASGQPVFSPCDDIPDEALRRIGVDPTTESPEILGVKQPGWNICKWRGDGPALSVFATTYTLDDLRSKEGNIEFSDVVIGDRAAVTYRLASDRDRRDCDAALASGGGAVLISVEYLGVDPITEDPCAVAVRHVASLIEFIPE